MGDSFTNFQFHIIKVLNDLTLINEPAKSVRALAVGVVEMIPDEVGVIGLALLGECVGIEVGDGHSIGVKSPIRKVQFFKAR